ncbi:hypothetical protein KEM52_002689, partial [Ascosphaera acerosa]
MADDTRATLSTAFSHDSPAPAVIVPAHDGHPTAFTASYAKLAADVAALQRELAQLGIGAGRAVSIALPNSYEFIVAFLAAAWQRGIAAPLNPAYKQDEFEFYIDDLSSALAVVPRGAVAADAPAVRAARRFGAAVAECYFDQAAGAVRLDVRERGKLAGESVAVPVQTARPDDVALVLHTSGTTGRPKAVPLTHRNLATTMRNIQATYALGPADRTMLVMPLFHVHGLLAGFLAPLRSGGSVVVPPRFSAGAFWRDFAAHPPPRPGLSTREILQAYVAIIRVFRRLDPRAVLLDRVARPIRRFLRERDDAARIIVGGVMADQAGGKAGQDKDEDEQHGDVLDEIAPELADVRPHDGPQEMDIETDLENDETIEALNADFARPVPGQVRPVATSDWDDPNWQPAPIDAAPDFASAAGPAAGPTTPDIIGSLISLFENKDAFVAELQKVLSDRLLRRVGKGRHFRERALLRLLRARFGAATSLQACEVMVRDCAASRRLDTRIHQHVNLRGSELDDADEEERAPRVPRFLYALMLSHLYWPRLPSRSFAVPPPVRRAQHAYAHKFATIRHSRKLTWLQSLGRATVELELADRTVREEVTTAQAAVIYAFGNGGDDDGGDDGGGGGEASAGDDMLGGE